jgi:antitoxin component YwqK of YwqJK toxin-antitoxin module
VARARIEEINASHPKASGVTKEFYDNGFLKHRGRIKNGEMHGAWEFFRRDGSPLRSGRFDRGDQVGLWTTFDRTGAPHRVTDFG